MRTIYDPTTHHTKTKTHSVKKGKTHLARITPKRKGPIINKYLLPPWPQIKKTIKKGR